MQISSRFTIAVHVLTCIPVLDGQMQLNSESIAGSIGVKPVVVRNIFRQLKKANLIIVQRGGNGGVSLARELTDITLLDVSRAVDSVPDGQLFHFHENPNAACPVGRNIHHVMDGRLAEIQAAMEEKMNEMTLADVVEDTEHLIARQNMTAG